MEVQDRSRSPSRKSSRVEQVVGRWLRRSRDLGSRSLSVSRDRVSADGKAAESSGSDQRNYPFRFNIQIQRDRSLNSHGITLSCQTPILVQDVIPGGPADGLLVPGDQLVKINNVSADDLTPEQAAEIIRECQDTLTMTVLRIMLGPKSSFITPEKRAKLRSNPVKVHFAEEVEVNGHSQGNSLLFLPNVLKVYLENGQTKAFKFDPSTTVKDIVMTVKEKLSLSRIEHFSLVLEQQHSVSKLLLLHDEERIQQVVQKKEAHDYRCLFRVCFMPKGLQTLLLDDPTAFEYLYLQGVNDVLQERFAVEMRCNTALRLAALHIQERLASCGQSPKTNLKTITKIWGIENFVSSTLLRNMREKDLRKAISYHMKKSQSQHDPRQKSLPVDQARINYLEELSDLKSFGGKSFSATMMLQDRESTVSLLVGARYGVSQVVNHKLSILSTLTEFTSITRIELLPESEKVSLVKIYLQDIKPITLLLETVAAKDMSCLIAGYCRVFVDPSLNVFPWTDDSKKHRVSAEEGYVSRCGSDSDSSSDLDMEPLVAMVSHNERRCPPVRFSSDLGGRKRKDRERRRSKDSKEQRETLCEGKSQEKDADTEKNKIKDAEQKDEAKKVHSGEATQIKIMEDSGEQIGYVDQERQTTDGEDRRAAEEQLTVSEASSSCHTDSRILTSPSSDSLDALEEDDLLSCSSSSTHPTSLTQTHQHTNCPIELHPYSQRDVQPHLLGPPPAHCHPIIHCTHPNNGGGGCKRSDNEADPPLPATVGPSQHIQKCSDEACPDDSSLCFAELSRLVDFLPSPPEASEEEDDEEEELRRRRTKLLKLLDESGRKGCEGRSISSDGGFKEHPLSPSSSSPSSHTEFVFNFDQSDARCYYNLCSNITPDSARSLPHPEGKHSKQDDEKLEHLDPNPILQPPPGFGDSSSDEEFFDARDRFTSPEDPTTGASPNDVGTKRKLDFLSTISLSDISVPGGDKDGNTEEDKNQREAEGGGRKTLFQLRKRSRKRRSFMETDYTSMVSYPEPHIESKQDPVYSSLHKNLLAQASDAHMLILDPEPSAQTQNPSPTVSSLSHSEGEPSQLESKPILSKPCTFGQGYASGLGPNVQMQDSKTPVQTRKQEMEMEPDAMECKSVTDLLKVSPPTITIVRCRIGPDGKESADRQGDGEEEEVGEQNEEKEKESITSLTGNGPFTSDMIIPDGANKEGGEDAQEERTEELIGGCTKKLLASEQEPEAGKLTTCVVIDGIQKISGRLFELCQVGQVKNLNAEEHMLEGVNHSPSFSPPLPPPPSPLPLIEVTLASLSDCLEREEEASLNMETSTGSSRPNSDKQQNINNAQLLLAVSTSVDDEEEIHVGSCIMTASDDITDSTNSDNVFEDDEVTNCLNSSSSDKKDDWVLASKAATEGKDNSQVIKCAADTEVYPNISSVNSNTAKTGAFTSSTLSSGDDTHENVSILYHNGEKPKDDSSMPSVEVEDSCSAPGSTNLCKYPPSPTQFLFQPCSPSIMGRLSASTIRGKIQNLPLYLSRSLETPNQAGALDAAPSPSKHNGRGEEITIQVTDVHSVTQTVDFDMGTAAESVESDDSDTTVTGSEVDGENFVETAAAKGCRLASEEKEFHAPLPIQTGPKPEQQIQFPDWTGQIENTPGPVTQPPAPRAIHQSDTLGLKMDSPGPIKDAPESKRVGTSGKNIPGFIISRQSPSISSQMVVTTQNLNGPGHTFHNQPQKVGQSSSDRPLLGLCKSSEQNSDPAKTFPSGCRVFTICEDPSHNNTAADVRTAPPLKSEFGCSSVLASGCESVMEGVQVPLEACGCPAVYTNCFSRGVSFDDELTIYEFSCRTQSGGLTPTTGTGLHMTAPAVPSFLCSSTTHSPSFPHSRLFSSSTSELSPLLSPLSDASDCFLSQTPKDTISRLGQQRYPEPPTGFQVLRVDVDQLLSILESSGPDRSAAYYGGRHAKDTCPAHFTENKRVLQIEARRLMAGCQKVVGAGQSPQEMLHSLADSFRTLVELTGICLWFSSCGRCDRRNAEAVAGLADVARSFRDFCLAAERASSKRGCQDLSTKLLAKQCTALTASVFCLTQLFRTLTAL